ncbi:hypothetical protein HZB74_00160 [Candidatus Saccharibacteria bacterium]|nr:hypothetical protein [Candidatus Saccharibacteria bacterium]
MLKLGKDLVNISVMSLRTGSPVGTAVSMIINPNNLKVEGWYVQDQFTKKRLVLLSGDVRDLVPQGLAVNDHEVLSEENELIRLKPVLEIGFELNGKYVAAQSGKQYGKVSEFAVETDSFLVKKIYVSQSIVKSFSTGSLSIDRTQIVEITNRTIIIEDPTETVPSGAGAPATANQ